jgi:hypothetical protein
MTIDVPPARTNTKRSNPFSVLSSSRACRLAIETGYSNSEAIQKHSKHTLPDGYTYRWPHTLVRGYRLPKRRLPRILPRPIVLDQQQEQLSWNQILFDPQFSTALWCDLQNSHLRCSPSTDSKHSGMPWILSMIITIWIEVQSHWEKVRNKERHSNTKVAHLNSKFAQVLHKTEALYKLKHSTLPCDQGAYNPTSNLRLFHEHNFFYFI